MAVAEIETATTVNEAIWEEKKDESDQYAVNIKSVFDYYKEPHDANIAGSYEYV